MLRPKYLKRAKLLRKGVRKFLSYKKDLLPVQEKEEIEKRLEVFDQAVSERTRNE